MLHVAALGICTITYIQTGQIMHILPSSSSQRMCIIYSVCKGYKTRKELLWMEHQLTHTVIELAASKEIIHRLVK